MLLIGAAATFVLAILGAVLPGLPTTPFLLLTSYCLVRSSKRLHGRLLEMRLFGPVLRDWQIHRGVQRGVKSRSIALIAVFVAATLWFSPLAAAAKVAVALLALCGVLVVARLPVVGDRVAGPASLRVGLASPAAGR